MKAAVAPSRSNPRRIITGSNKALIPIIEARAVALNLRKQGFDYRLIADKLTKLMHPKGDKRVSARTAYEYVQAELLALRQQTEMDAQSIRDLELERCDILLASLHRKINKGDVGAVMAAVKIMERRSRLLGLDAPTRSEVVGALMTITPQAAAAMSDDEIRQKVADLMNRVTIQSAVDRQSQLQSQTGLPDIDAEATVEAESVEAESDPVAP